MGNGSSVPAQCNSGTFGTGKGTPVYYDGSTMNLGGADICTTNIAECMRECEAIGCADAATCCKMCERACCYDTTGNQNNLICKQMNQNQFPDDYCTNSTSRQTYDQECPDGCPNRSAMDAVESKHGLRKISRNSSNFIIIIAIIVIFLALLNSYLTKK